MTDLTDGCNDTPEGCRKVFARRRSGESAEVFAQRAISMLEGIGYPLGEDSDDSELETPSGEQVQ